MNRALLVVCLTLCAAAPHADAQAAPRKKLAAAIERLFGRGARADSLRADSSTVLRVSRGDSLRIGKEIRGISGATISVHTVTAGVRRILADLTAWHRAGAIR